MISWLSSIAASVTRSNAVCLQVVLNARSPMRPRVALDQEPLLEVSGLGCPLLVGVTSMGVVEAYGSILSCREAVLAVA